MIEVDIALLGTALASLSIAFTGLYKVTQLLYSIERRLSKLEYGQDIEKQRMQYELGIVKEHLSEFEGYLKNRSSFEPRNRD